MKGTRAVSLCLAAALALALFAAGCSAEESGGLQSFSAVTLDGGSFTQEDIRNKDLTILNIWGTYCAPCVREMPDLAAFAQALPENVQFVTVCVDAGRDPSAAESILQQAGYEGITLVDGDGDFAALMNSIQVLPTTIFVDAKGNLAGSAIQGGGYENLSQVFLAAANQALKESGKAEIRLAP